MDRNSIIGFVLIFLLLIAYSFYNRQQVAERQIRERAVADSLAIEQSRQDSLMMVQRLQDSIRALSDTIIINGEALHVDSVRKMELAGAYGPFAGAVEGTATSHILENEHLKVSFSNLGGKIAAVEIKEFTTFRGDPVILFAENQQQFGLTFPVNNNLIRTDSLYFEQIAATANSVTYRLSAGDGTFIEQSYSLEPNSYWVDYNLTLTGMSRMIPPQTNLRINWNTILNLQERAYEQERNNSAVYYRILDGDVNSLSVTRNIINEPINYNLNWISFKQQFFNATLVAQNGFSSAIVSSVTPAEDIFLKRMEATIDLPYDAAAEVTYPMQFHFGPNNYNHLKTFNLEMEEMVPLGGWGLQYVNRGLILPIFNFFSRFTSNYGLIILLLAIFIKLILTPLTYKSYLSQAKMRVLRPELEEIREKHKDDMQKVQMEQMKLYRKTGVNMLGGCVPTLLQLPILIAMYRFFPASIHLRGAEFLWAEDLSTYDSILDLPFTIPFYGDHVSLFTILMALTSVLYAKLNSQMSAAASPVQMKMIIYIMPFFLIFIFNSLPAGLTYYYLLYNILSFGQQIFFQKFVINETAIRQKLEENKKKPIKVSKWQKKLEELQKIQAQQAKERGKKKK